jgi:hypothetical protein
MYQFGLIRWFSWSYRCRVRAVTLSPEANGELRLSQGIRCSGLRRRGDDMEQVVDAIGAQQQFSNTVTELPTGGDQELRLLRGGQREPGQLTTRGKVTGADDGRNWNLGVDVVQERTVSAGGSVLARRLGSGEANERGRQSRLPQTPREEVDDDSPVRPQMVALVEDHGSDTGLYQCIYARPSVR